MSTTIHKYLRQYAEADTHLAEEVSGHFTHCVIIPCRDEPPHAAEKIGRFILNRPDTLVIVIINQPESQHDQSLNHAFHACLNQPGVNNMLLVDRFSRDHRISDRQGVGLARKIGCDIACQLIHNGQIASPWIHTSDADVEWPETYPLKLDDLPSDTAAACYPFQHQYRQDRHGLALKLYEVSLNYYVAGLRCAGSLYAYHSLGSTLAIHNRHYCEVRGFPKRAGGEDFHILNKLRKTGQVHNLQQPLLPIQDRDSDRVPFGTGPAIARINALADPVREFQFYHPACFTSLQTLLNLLPSLWQSADAAAALGIASNTLPDNIYKGLLHCGLDKAISHAFGHSSDQTTWLRHINNHFDALANLRFVHFQRDHYFASINMLQLRQLRHFYAAELEQFICLQPDNYFGQARSVN